MPSQEKIQSHWHIIKAQFCKNRLGYISLWVVFLFFLIGLYAPFLASSKPLMVSYEGNLYFPLFRYLFFRGFFTHSIDIFYNILMFLFPLFLLGFFLLKSAYKKKIWLISLGALQCLIFLFSFKVKSPESTPYKKKAYSLQWDAESLSTYTKLNLLLRHLYRRNQQERFAEKAAIYKKATRKEMPTLWAVDNRNYLEEKQRLEKILKEKYPSYSTALTQFSSLEEASLPLSHAVKKAKFLLDQAEKKNYPQEIEEAKNHYEKALTESAPLQKQLHELSSTIDSYRNTQAQLAYLTDQKQWIEVESKKLKIWLSPLIRPFHWEDDAGGEQNMNRYLSFWNLTRINRKDLVASLIFGIRISLTVGIIAVSLALLIGIPLGMIAGYCGGKTDIVICRLIEIWEAMPTFFMLLLVVAIIQNKSLFLVILILGLFGWSGFSRFLRAEVLKQRHLPYVLAYKSLGYRHFHIMFFQILPNAIPPVLTLLPFSLMAAITSEAGLSFLGLGEEGSSSWGVLMDEGRSVFPGESYLLWPPAILLTTLLVAIALIGDGVRDALDPKMNQS